MTSTAERRPPGDRGEGSRRLAAVWFADIVGFTRLASEDEGAALRLVDLFEKVARKEIERHHGTLVKFMGDGVLAHFASTGEALVAALSFGNAFHELAVAGGRPAHVRIGVHVGDIAVSPTGDIHGDGVNVASRLQREAGPGAVVVSQDVWRQCRQRTEFHFVHSGPRELKGLPEPVRIYEVRLADVGEVPPAGSEAFVSNVDTSHVRDTRFLAVLPFENLSGTEEAESLATGLHNDLLTELSKVSGLSVISRTSVRGYKGTDKPVPQIASELRVGTLLEGAVQTAGSRVRLNVQLIDARRDVHRWAETYDRELRPESVFAMQSELTRRIVESLQMQLTPDQRSRSTKPPTRDLEAFRVHAQGRTELDRRTESGMRKARELFQTALERDPGYALAWVGLADSLALLADYGYEDDSILVRAENAARRALDLEPDLAEAHASLGEIHAPRREGPAAIRELKRAIELQPSYAEAHNWLGWVGLLVGRRTEALESAKRAVELNPLSPEAVFNLALSWLANGEARRALAEARRARELEPTWASGRFGEGLVLYHLGRFAEAEALLRGLVEPWIGSGPLATEALACVAAGNADRADGLVARIETAADPFALGLVHAALGDKERAFDAFQRVDKPRAWPNLAVRYFYPEVWAPLRDDPRYRELRRHVDRSWGLEYDGD